MKKDILSDEQNENILKAFDEAINNGPWDKSNFLQAIGKSLKEIRDNFAKNMNVRSKVQMKQDAYLANRLALRSGQQEVYISLYTSEGDNLNSWEKILSNLPRQMISRPIYANEEMVKDLIKMKVNKQNEAYVVFYINKTDIIDIPADRVLLDKLGNPLLTLKDKTLDLENVSRFVHVSGVYQFNKGRLIKER